MSTAINCARVCVFFFAVYFAMHHHFSTFWWRIEIAINVMAMTCCVIALSGVGIVQQIFGPGWALDVLRLLALVALAGVIIWRLVLLMRAQRRPDPVLVDAGPVPGA